MQSAELVAYARSFRAAVLGDVASAGMCAAVSGPLAAAFAVMGVSVDLRIRSDDDGNHVFMMLADGMVLDPTADQFGFAPVYLGPPLSVHADAERWTGGEPWLELIANFRRLVPAFEPVHVGSMVRRVLETLPSAHPPGLALSQSPAIHSAPP